MPWGLGVLVFLTTSFTEWWNIKVRSYLQFQELWQPASPTILPVYVVKGVRERQTALTHFNTYSVK